MQLFPFCWWLALVLDHHSRRLIGYRIFQGPPTSTMMRMFLGQLMHTARAVPKYIITDKGVQFWTDAFKRWCKRRGIIPRFGAVGQHGAIAVVERFFRTLKWSLLPGVLISFNRSAMHETLRHQIDWYNEYRAHTTLGGRTPNEVYFRRFPANRKPRIEPRPGWPRDSPCAAPWALVAGKPGAKFTAQVEKYHGQRNLPIITLHRAS